jgi:hypothetical protein
VCMVFWEFFLSVALGPGSPGTQKKKTTLVFTAHTAMLSFQFYLAFFTSRFSVLKEADGRRLATMSSSNNQKTCM